ncbi:RHS repeat-associated core domain-containing protein [Streptomyces aidingensis]|uniref:RHS repeat-associated core domain-containing protein n=2 Tax=Streptomyces aidingensis TaxID=910347 RepID=A0A1I1MBC0_9ACTN|nr:RHS repeat-associated core domain-containing protein [Streptomyces aidingensis]
MGRASDWSPVDMDGDPTPGDPSRIEQLGNKFTTFADDVYDALQKVRTLGEDGTLAAFVGESADAYREKFDKVPPNLEKLHTSYDLAGQALLTYAPKLEEAQRDADRALTDAEDARAELSTAQSWLERATSTLEDAEEEAEPPDEGEVSAEVRRALSDAQLDAGNAQTAVDDAREKLNAAIALAQQAREAREEAAERCKRDLEEASDAGMQNKKWWQKAVDWVVDNWDTIVQVAKIIAAVASIVALVLGGPLVWAVLLAASLVILADTLIKYANGEATLWDVGFAVLDCIPGGRIIGRGASAARTAARNTAQSVRREGTDLAQNSRPMANRFTSTDPVDFATGEVVLPAMDVELPGVLPLTLERHHLSTYRHGRWFGSSWASTLDQRLVLEEYGVRFLSADGMDLHYPVPLPDPETPVMPVMGPRWGLAWDGRAGSPLTIRQGAAGRTLHFAPVPGRPGNELPLVAVTDRNGNRIDFRYTAAGDPAEVAHSGGYRIGVAVYDGRVTALRLLSDPAEPLLLAYDYDHLGNLAEVYDSTGVPVQFAYDNEHRLVRWEDRGGFWYRYEYDGAGRCIFGTGTDRALECRYTYDPDNHRTTAINSLGHATVYQFNAGFQLVAETDPLGNTTRREWDPYDRPLAVTDPLGRTTHYEYNDGGQIAVVTRPDGAQTRIEYNELGLPTEIVEPGGAAWRQAYDRRGNLVAVVDPAGHRTRYAYDSHGAPASVTDVTGNTTTFRHDAAGLPSAITDPLGETTRYRRDTFGRPVEITDPLGNITRLTWSPEGKILRRVDALGSAETWEWDAKGTCRAHTDENGGVTRFTYGPFGILTGRTGADGAQYIFGYDTELNLLRVTGPEGRSWEYTYDAADRLTAESDPDGRTTAYLLDSAGRPVTVTNAAGQTVTHTYDAADGLIRKETSDGTAATYDYDTAGRIVHATAPGVTLTRRYDAMGNPVSETINGRTLTLAYDPHGRPLSRTTPTGHTSTWTYDAAGQPLSLAAGRTALTFAYDPMGRETTRTMGGSLALTQQWDPVGRLTGQTLTAADGPGRSDGRNRRLLHHRSYRYRTDHYLTALTDGTDTTRFTLDGSGRITEVTGPDRTEKYLYDTAGNQLLAHCSGSVGQMSAEATGERAYAGGLVTRAGSIRYRHDEAGRTVLRQQVRISRKPDTWRYTWDAENRLTAVTTPDGSQWRYLYDPFGRRIAKQRLGTDGATVVEQTDFTWHDTTLVEQTTTGPEDAGPVTLAWDHAGLHPLTQSEYGPAEPDSPSGTDARFYAIVTDLVGTPTQLLDEHGETVWRARSTVWGITEAASRSGGAATPLRFPGQYADEETGWHYNYNRHYDPRTGRYTSPDPLGLLAGPQPYAYPHNPHTWCDPLGLTGNDLRPGYTSSPALVGDPYHPDTVAERSARNQDFYGPLDSTPQQSTADRARELGYPRRIPPQRAPFDSHGQPVFTNGKRYITPDIDGHNVSNGWKVFDRKGRRIGTYDANLNYVKK